MQSAVYEVACPEPTLALCPWSGYRSLPAHPEQWARVTVACAPWLRVWRTVACGACSGIVGLCSGAGAALTANAFPGQLHLRALHELSCHE